MFHIRWTNKFSNEQGYVGAVKRKERHFVNADADHAKKYHYKTTAEKDIALLTEYGEADNNILEVVVG